MKAINLKVEYLNSPIGLGIKKPHFYWNCEGGVKQSAYQIICKKEDEVIWDSKKVNSSSMIDISYEGKELDSRDIVNWSVKLWDENDTEGQISESSFEMGLLEDSDFKAKWIAGDYKPQKNIRYSVDCFKKCFSTDKKINKARLYASARGLYDVFINGKRIEDFILAPGMSDYRKRIQYQTYDIASYLGKDNVIELRLADGWYRGSSAAYGLTNVYGDTTSIFAQFEIEYEDHTKELLCTDESWSWSNDGPIRFADLKDGEVYNALFKPTYNGHAKVVEAPKAKLVASNNVYVKEKEHFKPTIINSFNDSKVLDFGQNIAGYLKFSLKGKKNQTFKLVCGEILDSFGHVDLSNIQEVVPSNRTSQMAMMIKLMTNKPTGIPSLTPLQEIDFTCSGDLDEYKTSFAIFGFRYVEVIGNVEFKDIEAIAVYSDLEETSTFDCSNKLVDKLYENTLWSMKSNYLDLPTDCPTRERLGWTGDAQIFFNAGAYLMNTAPFFKKWIVDVEDAQNKNGVLPAVIPFQGLSMMYENTGVSVGWADAIYLIPYRFYKMYGNIEILEKTYPIMKKYTDYLFNHLGMTDKKEAKKNPYNEYTYEKGIHLGEWLEPDEYKEKIAGNKRPKHPEEATAYFYLTMETMKEIATILGKDDDAKKFDKYANGAKEAYNYLFVKTGTLDTDRQAKLVRPLALGLLDGEDKRWAQDRLIKAIKNKNYHVTTGFLSTVFLLPEVCKANDIETAYKVLENKEKPGWLSEVLSGATTIWESWEGDVSHNHYSPGSVVEWLFEGICGINISGENIFTIKPLVGGSLTYASGSYKSIYGEIKSSWKKENGKTIFTLTIPSNTTATIILPNGNNELVNAGTYTYEV